MATATQPNGPFEEVPLDNSDTHSVSSESSYDLLSDDEIPNDPAAASEDAAPIDVAPQPNDNEVEPNDFQDVEVDAKRAQLRSKLAAIYYDLMGMINYADDSNPTDAEMHTNLFRMKANEFSALFGDDVDDLKNVIRSLQIDISNLESVLVESKKKEREFHADIQRLTKAEKLLKERLHEVKVERSLAEGETVASKMKTQQKELDLELLTEKYNDIVQEKQELDESYESCEKYVTFLRNKYESLHEEEKALRTEKTVGEELNKDLKKKISELSTQVITAHTRLEAEEARSMKLAEEVEISGNKISRLEREHSKKVTHLTEQLELAQAHEKTCSAEKRQLKACVARLQDEKRASAKAYTHYESRITEFKATIDRMTKELVTTQDKLEAKEELEKHAAHKYNLALKDAATGMLQHEGMQRKLEGMERRLKEAQEKASEAERKAYETEQRATAAEQRANEAEQEAIEAEQRTKTEVRKIEKEFLEKQSKYREGFWSVIRQREAHLTEARREASAAKQQAEEAEGKLKQFREFQNAVAERKLKAAVKDEGETTPEEVSEYEAWLMGRGFPASLKTFTYHQLRHFIQAHPGTTPISSTQIGMTGRPEAHPVKAQEWNLKSEFHLAKCRALDEKLSELQRKRWAKEREPTAILESSRFAEEKRRAARAPEQKTWDKLQRSAYMAGRAGMLALCAQRDAVLRERIAKEGSKEDIFDATFKKHLDDRQAESAQALAQQPKSSEKKTDEDVPALA